MSRKVFTNFRDASFATVNPRGKPTANIASAGYGGKVVKLIEQSAACQTLEHAQGKGGAANPAAGDAKRRSFLRKLMGQRPDRFEPGSWIRLNWIVIWKIAMKLHELILEHLVQLHPRFSLRALIGPGFLISRSQQCNKI